MRDLTFMNGTQLPNRSLENNVGPNPDQWKRASDMNGQVIAIPDIDVWKYLAFFENIKVENSDSEGKYFEQFSITVAPTL